MLLQGHCEAEGLSPQQECCLGQAVQLLSPGPCSSGYALTATWLWMGCWIARIEDSTHRLNEAEAAPSFAQLTPFGSITV